MSEEIAFGYLIRNLRKENKISSTKLSALISKGSAYISQVENNRIQNPDYDTCYKLLEVLNVDPDKIQNVLMGYNIFPTNKKPVDVEWDKLNSAKDTLSPSAQHTMTVIDQTQNFISEMRASLKSGNGVTDSILFEMEKKLRDITKDAIKLKFYKLLEVEEDKELFIEAVEEMIRDYKNQKKG